jgi:ribose transport system ATP-binding protein
VSAPSLDAFRLDATGLRKSFGGVEVLHGVGLTAIGGRVLALLGENGAGKSTAVKILAGDYDRDAGEIQVNGQPAAIASPADAERAGIKVIFQEFMDAPELSVAENIVLGHLPHRWGFVRWSSAHERASRILDELGVELDVHRSVETLSVAQRQIVEIARALTADARLLILDEPTSALAAEEVDHLFRFIRKLRERGVAIIYITHRLDEVRQIADDVLVFRDGHVVTAGPAAEYSPRDLVEAMVGSDLDVELSRLDDRHDATDDETTPVLSITGAAIEGLLEGVDVEVHPGRIVALFGRLGCGSIELAEAVFGLRRLASGTVRIQGREGQPRSPSDAIARGVGYVPVDRKTQGILSGLSVAENLSVAAWGRQWSLGLVLPGRIASAFARWTDVLRISAPQGPQQFIETLSGGNQQKVVLGRWLEQSSKILILVEPTRGVDVGARAEIYRVLQELAGSGVGILIVSSDIEEAIRISDEIVVLSRGAVSATFSHEQFDRAELTHAAAMKEVSS